MEYEEEHESRIVHSLMLIKAREIIQRAFYHRDERTLLAIASMIGTFESRPGEEVTGVTIFENFLNKLDWRKENGVPLYLQRGSARPKGSDQPMMSALIFTDGDNRRIQEVMMLYPAVDGTQPIIERAFILRADQCDVEVRDKPLMTPLQLHNVAVDTARKELELMGFTIIETIDDPNAPINMIAHRQGMEWKISVRAAFYPNVSQGLSDLQEYLAQGIIEEDTHFGIYSVCLINLKEGEEYFTHDPSKYTVFYKSFNPLIRKKPRLHKESSLWVN